MRSESQIRQQLKQVLFRHLQKDLRENFRKSPETCTFNKLTALANTQERVGICRCDLSHENDPNFPYAMACDSRIAGGFLRAKNCKWWMACRTKDEVRKDFRGITMSGDRGRIASGMPDVVALMWVLDSTDIESELAGIEADLADQDSTVDWKSSE